MSEKPVITGSRTAVMVAIATINEELSKLSNKEAREALTMVVALRNLRVIPMDRPIGLSPPNQKAIASGIERKGRRAVSQPKALWKSDPSWAIANEEHKKLVDQIKASSDPNLRKELAFQLHDMELKIRSLKQSLRGESQRA